MTNKVAYHGYLICTNLHGTWIEKDGVLICWVKNYADATRIIRTELHAAVYGS